MFVNLAGAMPAIICGESCGALGQLVSLGLHGGKVSGGNKVVSTAICKETASTCQGLNQRQ